MIISALNIPVIIPDAAEKQNGDRVRTLSPMKSVFRADYLS